MPHFLIQAAYTAESWAAQVKAQPDPRDRVGPLAEGVGGRLGPGSGGRGGRAVSTPPPDPLLASSLPEQPVRRWLRPLARFLHVQSAGGVVLLICTVVALALANSPAAAPYHAFWHTRVSLEVDEDLTKLDGVMDNQLPEPLRLTAYRAVEEALNNVHRHARASLADLVRG